MATNEKKETPYFEMVCPLYMLTRSPVPCYRAILILHLISRAYRARVNIRPRLLSLRTTLIFRYLPLTPVDAARL